MQEPRWLDHLPGAALDGGIETVIVAGLTTAVCVSSSARDAFQLDFHTITLSDCCAESNT